MYFHAFVFLFVAVISAEALSQLPGRFNKAHDKCQSDPASYVDEAILEKVRRGEKVTAPNLAKHTLCMNVESGVQDQNGEIIVENLRKFLERAGNTKEKVDEAISKCGTRTSAIAEEAAVALTNCVIKFRPERRHNR
uniref:Odorant-binding protein n=1 Tax=Galeruca daurica TaxID=1651263 RepID=A0A1U9W513_9CUCU|nr:odorant-binding protein [Galeruca daurica]